jgi:hypothetical protein
MSKESQGGRDQNYNQSKEQAKPQGEGAANPSTREKKIEKVSLPNPGRTVFDCVVPKIVPSPEGVLIR